MKLNQLSRTAVVAFLTTLAISTSAQERQEKHHHYQLIDMGRFGGPQSYIWDGYGERLAVSVVNRRGQFTGWADTSQPDPFCFFYPDCFAAHAFEWEKGIVTDLGVLPNGATSASTSISPNGLIAGVSENGLIDPLVPGFPEGHAVLWQNGSLIDLGTLEGGYESLAFAVNSSGQVAGLFTNTTADPNSMFGTGYQARAFFWQNGVMQDLGTLGGPDAQALLINERGQVVGWSYTSSSPGACGFIPLATGSFIWQEGKGMRDLGNFGGTCTQATDLNSRGQVVGLSNPAGDLVARGFLWSEGTLHKLGGSFGGSSTGAFALNEGGEAVGFGFLPGDTVFHAALWRRVGQITDLGTVVSGESNFAESVNAKAQVVGAEYNSSGAPSAFLWEDGSIMDLNTLIPPGSSLHLQFALNINDHGEIAVTSVDAQGNEHAVLLIPCDDHHFGVEGCDYALMDAATAAQVRALQEPHSSTLVNQNHDRPVGLRDRLDGRLIHLRGLAKK